MVKGAKRVSAILAYPATALILQRYIFGLRQILYASQVPRKFKSLLLCKLWHPTKMFRSPFQIFNFPKVHILASEMEFRTRKI